MKIHYATISETGKRQNNEDAFRIVNSEDGNHWLAVVCDGMRGHAMGEVASETVSDAIVDYWKKHTDEPHHSPLFNIDEDVLWEGSAVFVNIAERFLAE